MFPSLAQMTVIGMVNVIPIVVNASVLRDFLVTIVLLIVDVQVTEHVNLVRLKSYLLCDIT